MGKCTCRRQNPVSCATSHVPFRIRHATHKGPQHPGAGAILYGSLHRGREWGKCGNLGNIFRALPSHAVAWGGDAAYWGWPMHVRSLGVHGHAACGGPPFTACSQVI